MKIPRNILIFYKPFVIIVFCLISLGLFLLAKSENDAIIQSRLGTVDQIQNHQSQKFQKVKYQSDIAANKSDVVDLDDHTLKQYVKSNSSVLSGFEKQLPLFAREQLFGMKIWKYTALIVYLIASFILYRFFAWIFEIILKKVISRTRFKKITTQMMKPISKPISMLSITILLLNYLPILDIPAHLNKIFMSVLIALIPFFITYIVYKSINLFGDIINKIAEITETKLDNSLIPLGRKIVKIFVVLIGAIYILKSLNVDITPLIAGVSIGGLAIALAAQDTVKNLFGSVTIFIDKPFEVGDWIVFADGEGAVEEVGVRSTRIRTANNSLISVPNGKFADSTIDNMGRRKYRRYTTNISITYDTDPKLIDEFVDGLRQIVEQHPKTRKDTYQVHLNSFGESSLNILFNIFFEVPDQTTELKARHEVINNIIQLAQNLGVHFALPTRTIFFENNPGKENENETK